MDLVNVVAIVAAGVGLIGWRLIRLYNIVAAIEEQMGDKLNEVIEQCNENTSYLNDLDKERTARKNGRTKTQR